MALIKNPLSGGGGGGDINIVNGVIEQYKAAFEGIDAYTFVEKINSSVIEGDSEDLGTVGFCRAAALSSDKAVVAWLDGDSIKGAVATVSGGNISLGSTATLSTPYSPQTFSILGLDSGMVVIAYNGSNSNQYLCAKTCSISGDTITANSETVIQGSATYRYQGIYTNMAKTENGSIVLVNYGGQYTDSNYWYARVLSVSGTSVSAGTRVQLSNNQSLGMSGAIPAVSPSGGDGVLIGYSESSSQLYGVFCSVSGNSISKTTSTTAISSSSYSARDYSCCMVSNNNCLVVWAEGASIRAAICSLNDTTMTVGQVHTITTLSSSITGANSVAVEMMNSEGALVLIRDNNSNMHAFLVLVSSNDISDISPEVILSVSAGSLNYWVGLAKMSQTLALGIAGTQLVLLSVREDNSFYAMKAATTEDSISGLTTQSITTTTAGDVWVLNTNES